MLTACAYFHFKVEEELEAGGVPFPPGVPTQAGLAHRAQLLLSARLSKENDLYRSPAPLPCPARQSPNQK